MIALAEQILAKNSRHIAHIYGYSRLGIAR